MLIILASILILELSWLIYEIHSQDKHTRHMMKLFSHRLRIIQRVLLRTEVTKRTIEEMPIQDLAEDWKFIQLNKPKEEEWNVH